jgi:hypothetical protein
MHRAFDQIPTVAAPGPFDPRLGAGLTALGLVAAIAAVFAALAMWTLLTSPDRVASAAPGGLPALFRVVLETVFEAARPLVAYL